LARVDQEAVAAAAGATTECRQELASTAYGIGELLAGMGKPVEAEAEYRNMLSLAEQLALDNPGAAEYFLQTGVGRLCTGNMLATRGKSRDAEVEFRKALEIFEKLAKDNPNIVPVQSRLGASHHSLGILLEDIGKSSEAGTELLKALAIRQKVADDHTAPAFQRELARSLDTSGLRTAHAGNTDEAIVVYAREEAIRQKLVAGGSANPDDRSALANCQTNAADVLRRSGRLDEARGMCERALAMSDSLVGSHPAVPGYRAGLAKTCLRLGQVHYEIKDLGGAADAWKRALVNYGAIQSLGNWDTFLMACCHAGLAGLAGQPGSGVSATEGVDQAVKAMALLRQVATLSFRNLAYFRTESALDPLRSRDDFRLLMMDVSFPVEPFAPVR
jgi:tetratricopeptide (TPR) repeat protein